MLVIELNKEKNIENALKTLKNKVQKTRLIQQLRERQEYVKPSVKRRSEILKAKYVQKKRESLDN
jgi:small subunit ribosomal protein S21